MATPDPPDFGQLLRRFRTAAALSQEELAERAVKVHVYARPIVRIADLLDTRRDAADEDEAERVSAAIDVALPRRDSKKGRGHKGFEVAGDPSMSFEDAARRRDFTINAMAWPLTDGELIDPHGGLEDLRAGALRVLHEDADEEMFQPALA